jgi:small ligand-binding sensory domain FIST
MKRFPCGHATHPQWPMAASLALAQLRAQLLDPDCAPQPRLALLYITDRYASAAQAILDFFVSELPEVSDWVGTVGVGVAVSNAEYFDEPALAVLLCDLPVDQYRVFSGLAPLGAEARSGAAVGAVGAGFNAHTALVHADGNTPDLGELIAELAGRTATGYVFGGVAASRGDTVQFAKAANRANLVNGDVATDGAKASSASNTADPIPSAHVAKVAPPSVFTGGLSGVAFSEQVGMVSRVTQGCQPLAGSVVRRVTAADANVVLALDGQPALDVLTRELNISLDPDQMPLQQALQAVRATLVGLTAGAGDAMGRSGNFGTDTRVRHIIGLDPARRGIAVAERVAVGDQLVFCQRNAAAAKADLTRICTEIREELEQWDETVTGSPDTAVAGSVGSSGSFSSVDKLSPSLPAPARTAVGAIYVSCSGRGGAHFGAPSAELQCVRRALGDVPLVGFFAGGEIAHQQIYAYTGVLTVFTAA